MASAFSRFFGSWDNLVSVGAARRSTAVVTGLLAFCFGSAGIEKLIVGTGTAELRLAQSGLLPAPDAVAIARLLPYLEISLAAWLLLGVGSRRSTSVALGALALFSAFLIHLGFKIGWSRPCGCMHAAGPSRDTAGARTRPDAHRAVSFGAVGTAHRFARGSAPRSGGEVKPVLAP